MSLNPFHLAFRVHDLEAARTFYADVIGCEVGRQTDRWIDFNLFGHQITAHRVAGAPAPDHNPVDGDAVPVPHFGVILPWAAWHALKERLEHAEVSFIIPPRIRFQGEVGEQATLFFCDPSGNALEFKSFKDPSQIFATVSD